MTRSCINEPLKIYVWFTGEKKCCEIQMQIYQGLSDHDCKKALYRSLFVTAQGSETDISVVLEGAFLHVRKVSKHKMKTVKWLDLTN